MKCFLLFGSLLTIVLTEFSIAMPVLNKSAPAGPDIMVYVDHLDANVYYLSPESISVKKDENGRPVFSYFEYRSNDSLFSPKQAIMQMLITPTFNSKKIEDAKTAIRLVNPNATFASLPFVRSSIIFSPDMVHLVNKGSCNHGAGDIGQAIDCTIDLTSRGRKTIGDSLKVGQFVTVRFEYNVIGVLQQANGSYIDGSNIIAVGGIIGGSDFTKYPDLFKE